MPRALDQIQAELQSAYQPQADLVNQQIAALPQYYDAQAQGLGVQKENAFRDITNQASARGMAYSGMPIAEQTRYLGSSYLPALAGLQQQQSQQRYSLQASLNDINSQRLQRAQAIQQQELDREQAQRQFDQNVALQREMAAANRAMYGGGSSSSGSEVDYEKAARQAASGYKAQALTQGNIQPGERENALNILKSQFGDYLSPDKLNNIIYNQVFTNGWEGNKMAPATPVGKPWYKLW